MDPSELTFPGETLEHDLSRHVPQDNLISDPDNHRSTLEMIRPVASLEPIGYARNQHRLWPGYSMNQDLPKRMSKG